MTVPTPIIDHDKLRGEIKKNSVRIIDVRREDDYKQGHIKNSVNLPLAKLLKDDNPETIAKIAALNQAEIDVAIAKPAWAKYCIPVWQDEVELIEIVEGN